MWTRASRVGAVAAPSPSNVSMRENGRSPETLAGADGPEEGPLAAVEREDLEAALQDDEHVVGRGPPAGTGLSPSATTFSSATEASQARCSSSWPAKTSTARRSSGVGIVSGGGRGP